MFEFGELGFQKDCAGPVGIRERVLQERREAFAVRDSPPEDGSAESAPPPSPPPDAPPDRNKLFFSGEFLPVPLLRGPAQRISLRLRRKPGQLVLLRLSSVADERNDDDGELRDGAFRGQREAPPQQLHAHVGASSHEEALQRYYLLCSEPR